MAKLTNHQTGLRISAVANDILSIGATSMEVGIHVGVHSEDTYNVGGVESTIVRDHEAEPHVTINLSAADRALAVTEFQANRPMVFGLTESVVSDSRVSYASAFFEVLT